MTRAAAVAPGAPPGPRAYPLVGVFPRARRDPLRFFLESARTYGDVVALPLGTHRVYLVSHPDLVGHVLQETSGLLRKHPSAGRIRPLFGDSLTTVDGDEWRRRRRLMRPAFQPQRLTAAVPAIVEVAGAMLERWRGRAEPDAPLDAFAEMTEVTRAILLRLVFGDVPEHEAREVGQALTLAVEHVNRGLWSPLGWLERFTVTRAPRYARALATLDAFVSRRVAEGRRGGHADGGLLSVLLEARGEERGGALSPAELRDEVKALFVAGHTTTAAGLAWVWHLLSQDPGTRRRLGEEVHAVLATRTPGAEDLSALPHTRMVIEEALRLYPPTWVTARTTADHLDLGGYRIPAGAIVLLSPFVTHRHPLFWDDPERFDPGRFAPERSAGRARFAYFPFGGGPRACIGSALALIEMQIIVAMVAQRYELTAAPGGRVAPEPGITLRPRHGVTLALRPTGGVGPRVLDPPA